MNRANSKAWVGAVCFVLGIATLWAGQWLMERVSFRQKYDLKYPIADSIGNFSAPGQAQALGGLPGSLSGGGFNDPFEQMRRMQEMQQKMMQRFNQGSMLGFDDDFFGNHLQFKLGGSSSAGDVTEREDDHYIYYDISIKGLKPEKVKVKVQNGQLSVSGQVESQSQLGGGVSYVSSSFERSFPVPESVDAQKVQIDQQKDKLTVKFPRV